MATVETFRATTTWTAPATMTVQVLCIGAGAGGTVAKTGGGSGASAADTVNVTKDSVYDIIAPAGGASNGNPSGNTIFRLVGQASIVEAACGSSITGGLAINSIGATKFNGANGGSNFPAGGGKGGGGASSAGSASAGQQGASGSAGSAGVGGTAVTDGGAGGNGGAGAANGQDGGDGSGGGGGGGTGVSGAGGPGKIMLTYTLPESGSLTIRCGNILSF